MINLKLTDYEAKVLCSALRQRASLAVSEQEGDDCLRLRDRVQQLQAAEAATEDRELRHGETCEVPGCPLKTAS